jgi:hypothetical protein
MQHIKMAGGVGGVRRHRRLHRVPGGKAQFPGVVYTAPPIYQAFSTRIQT